jgi:hypothetical protein
MKKVLLAVLIVFFASALYAGTNVDPLAVSTQAARDKVYSAFGTPQVQFDISGELDIRGLSWQNINGTKDGTVNTNYMKSYLDLWPKLKVGDTALITKLEMFDQNPWAPYPVVGFSDTPNATSKKDQVSVERCYVHHNITPDITLDAGLMDGNWWGTSFMDTQLPRYRVKIIDTKTPVGVVGALFEKDTETGTIQDPTTKLYIDGADRRDGDAYALFGVTKVADITIKPLIFYVPNSNALNSSKIVSNSSGDIWLTSFDDGNRGTTIWYYALASDGKLGPLSFESEAGYKTYRCNLNEDLFASTKTPATAYPVATVAGLRNTWEEFGIYLNLWNDIDFGRVGATFAYGNYDATGGPTKAGWGNDFGDDFKSNLILGDEKGFGANNALDLYGMTLIKPYIKYVKLGVDNLTGSASLGYIKSNQNGKNGEGDYSIYKGLTAYELDLGVQYKLSQNLMYKVDGGYAKISPKKDYWVDANGSDKSPKAVELLRHELVFTF